MIGMQQSIQSWIRSNQSMILQLVQDLIRFNTVNNGVSGSEKDCQNFVAEFMRRMNLEVDLFSPEDVPGFREHPAYYPGKDYSERPNVVGLYKGTGEGKSLLFSSHIDTTVVAKGWKRDPWMPVIDDDKLYGLGSFDMKGGLAASLVAVRCVKELGVTLMGDVLVESVVDEEFGGANGTLASRLRGYNPDAAVIPEPTNMAVSPATRGGAQWRVTFKGNTGMSYSGETIVNPVNTAAKFIVFLEEFELRRSSEPGPAPWYDRNLSLPVMVTRVEAGDMSAAICDTGPSECFVDIWVECYPGVTEEQLQYELMEGFRKKYEGRIMAENEPQFDKMIRFLPGTQLEEGHPLIQTLAEITASVTRGRCGEVSGAPFACDAFMFNLYSPTPAIVLGPMGANAHAPEEYIDIPDFYKLIEVYALFILQWCGFRAEGE